MYELIFLLLFVCLLSIDLLDQPEKLRRVGGKFPPPQQPKRFGHSVPVESIANTGISVRVSKQREVTGHRKKAAVHKKTVSVGNWFSTPGSMSLKRLSSVIVSLRFSTYLSLSLTH